MNGLMDELNIEYNPEEWRLFIDSSKLSLKAVLLHNGNTKPSIPVAMKETYENMSVILKAVNYNEHGWEFCGDLKVIALLLGLQGGFTKFCCFLCLWDSRATAQHYVTKNRPIRQDYIPGEHNIKYPPLVQREKVILPPLHIKLGLMKNFVKALDKNGEAFHYLKALLPKISDAKLKEGIFFGPQIRKLLNDNIFEKTLNPQELPE